jgi:O-antigen/teichoic acid export membrane protein
MSDGRRAGLLVLIASFAGHAANYLFYVITARMVTPAEFAAVSALIAFGSMTWMPVNGVQMSMTRNVAVLRTSGTPGELSAYLRQQARRMGVAALVLAVVIAASSPVLAERLHLGSAQPVLLAAMWIGTTCVLLVLIGAVQGMERFGYVAFALAGPLGVLRPLLLPLCLLAAGMSGSMWAMLFATLIGLAVLIPPVVRAAKPTPTTAPASTNTLATMIGLLAFSSLTNVDLLVAQATLLEHDRALYAGAVLLGKVALFAPAALAMVLLPRAAAALERGESADRAVLRTLALTGAAGLAVTLALWLMPTWVLTVTFGPAYGDAKPLLPALALVMTGAAVLWVHLTFAIARKSKRMVIGLVTAAVGHWVLLALLHGTPWQVILASGISVGSALVVVEVGSRSGALRMLLHALKSAKTSKPSEQAEVG